MKLHFLCIIYWRFRRPVTEKKLLASLLIPHIAGLALALSIMTVHSSRTAQFLSLGEINYINFLTMDRELWNIYLNLYFHFLALVSGQSSALSSATQHAMPPVFGGKWGTEFLNTRFPLPNLLCAGYSEKLK